MAGEGSTQTWCGVERKGLDAPSFNLGRTLNLKRSPSRPGSQLTPEGSPSLPV